MVRINKRDFKHGVVTGLGWAFGVTIGFAIISTVLVFLLNMVNKIPFIGENFGEIINKTETTIEKRTPLQPN